MYIINGVDVVYVNQHAALSQHPCRSSPAWIAGQITSSTAYYTDPTIPVRSADGFRHRVSICECWCLCVCVCVYVELTQIL